jgi:hypothetical protein
VRSISAAVATSGSPTATYSAPYYVYKFTSSGSIKF